MDFWQQKDFNHDQVISYSQISMPRCQILTGQVNVQFIQNTVHFIFRCWRISQKFTWLWARWLGIEIVARLLWSFLDVITCMCQNIALRNWSFTRRWTYLFKFCHNKLQMLFLTIIINAYKTRYHIHSDFRVMTHSCRLSSDYFWSSTITREVATHYDESYIPPITIFSETTINVSYWHNRYAKKLKFITFVSRKTSVHTRVNYSTGVMQTCMWLYQLQLITLKRLLLLMS